MGGRGQPPPPPGRPHQPQGIQQVQMQQPSFLGGGMQRGGMASGGTMGGWASVNPTAARAMLLAQQQGQPWGNEQLPMFQSMAVGGALDGARPLTKEEFMKLQSMGLPPLLPFDGSGAATAGRSSGVGRPPLSGGLPVAAGGSLPHRPGLQGPSLGVLPTAAPGALSRPLARPPQADAAAAGAAASPAAGRGKSIDVRTSLPAQSCATCASKLPS